MNKKLLTSLMTIGLLSGCGLSPVRSSSVNPSTEETSSTVETSSIVETSSKDDTSSIDETSSKVEESSSTHEHTYATEWSKDADKHWHAATCEHDTLKADEADHTWDAGTTTGTATCTEAGEITYTCTVCGYEKTEATNALNHNYGAPTYAWADDNSTVTATMVCANDATHIVTETVTASALITQSQSCTDVELTTYTATFTNDAFETQVKENVQTKDALTHSYGAPTYEWSADNSTVTATMVCNHDSTHVVTETATTTATVTQEQSCDNAELTTYTATFTNDAFEAQTKENVETKAALTHSYGTTIYTWSEDNSTVTATRVCGHNGEHKETETVNTVARVTQEQTYENPELTTYTATFENTAFETQVKENVQTKNAVSNSWNTWDGTKATSIALGSGTETDPYIISTSSELAFVAQKTNEGDSSYLNAYYKQMSNLDLNNINWTPIASTSPFKGVFDGNGLSIIGLSINQTGDNAALFAVVNNATIKNLNVTGTVVGGGQCNAILVAKGAAATLSNCISRGSVTGTGLYSSGIMSIVNHVDNTKTIIDNCVNYANIKCSNSGTAGISAYLNGAVTEIKNCKNYGNISYASHYVGGIVGRALKAEGSFIENCYNYGDISQYDTTTSVTTVAGVIGDTAIKVKNCYNYYKSTINGYSINAGTALLYPTTAGGNTNKKGAICGLLRAANVCSSDAGFVDCGICDKDGNVVFSGDVNLWDASVATSIASGTGTETDPYLINTGAELAFMAQQVKANDASYKTAYYKLNSNIHLNNKTWTSIGTSNTIAFQGHFDGNGKAIIGLKQNTAAVTGLFGHIADAYISNLTVIGDVTCSGANNGLLVGRAQPSTITNCTTLGTVTNTSQYAGAITATINAYASGVTGSQTKMIIENCTNYADITGVKRIGSLTSSQNNAVPTDFINCVNYGTITGTGSEIGGLVGILSSTGTMKDCTNYGQFNAPTAATNNPLVGNNGGTVTNCHDYH